MDAGRQSQHLLHGTLREVRCEVVESVKKNNRMLLKINKSLVAWVEHFQKVLKIDRQESHRRLS